MLFHRLLQVPRDLYSTGTNGPSGQRVRPTRRDCRKALMASVQRLPRTKYVAPSPGDGGPEVVWAIRRCIDGRAPDCENTLAIRQHPVQKWKYHRCAACAARIVMRAVQRKLSPPIVVREAGGIGRCA